MKTSISLLVALLMALGTAQAFSPYNGLKFEDAKFTASGFGETAKGSVDFKFKDVGENKATMTFKAKVTGGRIKGKIKFKPNGKFEAEGVIPGSKDTVVRGDYRIVGTTIEFDGEKTVRLDGFPVRFALDGKITLTEQGDVKVKIDIDAEGGGVGAKGKFLIDSSKEPKEPNPKQK